MLRAMVMVMVARVRPARVEAVRRLAVSRLVFHRVVGSLVASGSRLAHVLELFEPIGHDALPLAIQRPLVAVLL